MKNGKSRIVFYFPKVENFDSLFEIFQKWKKSINLSRFSENGNTLPPTGVNAGNFPPEKAREIFGVGVEASPNTGIFLSLQKAHTKEE